MSAPVEGMRLTCVYNDHTNIALLVHQQDAALIAAAPDLLAAMPTLHHPAGKLLKVVAHYEDGTTQTIDGEVIQRAVSKATGE